MDGEGKDTSSKDSTRYTPLMRYGLKPNANVRISPSATIDDMVVIEGNVNIGAHARIGFGSMLLGDANGEPINIGEHVRVGSFTSIRAHKHPVLIDEDVSIGKGCVINYDNKDPGMPRTGPVHIGRGTILGPYCLINNNVDIGEDNNLGAFTRLEYYVTLGKHNRLRGCFLGVDPQDRIFSSEREDAAERAETTTPTYVVVGDSNEIREGVRISRGTTKNLDKTTRIGHNNLIMDNTHAAHDITVGNHVTITTGCKIAGHCVIEDYANLAGAVKIAPFIHVGACAYVTGNTSVAEDALPYFIYGGKDDVQSTAPNYHGINRMLRHNRAGFNDMESAALEEVLGAMRDHINGKLTLEELTNHASPIAKGWTAWVLQSQHRKQQRKPAFKRGLETF